MKACALLTLASCLTIALGGCDNLAKGTKEKPLQESKFFDNANSSRPPPPHSIAQGQLHAASLLYAGRNSDGSLATEFPWPVTISVLARGRQQFDAICANCHGADGYGHGIIVQRGFPQPPSMHGSMLMNAPAGHFFDVITNGHGAMFPYANIISVEDRWAITAYIRALQRSQHANEKDALPQEWAKLSQEAPPK